ncbi:necdin-like 2 [Colossoma macropomum]|uniref:necdin-like 2 n=1 Tax=Colossoma macropomum TaxID=42526 RepID=UPI00186503F4|nr:necdin-like 2 [Colossoma macropomum]
MSQRKRVAAVGSQNKNLRRSQQVVLDEDDDVDMSLTQPTSSQVQKARENFTPVQVDRKVAEVVQFILIKDQKKIPIRRADIAKHVIKEYKALYQDIMKRADRTFEQVFGLKLVEIDSKNHIYILVNKLQPVPGEPISMCPGNPKTGLLFVILSIIFMKGGTVKENVVWNTLKKLRVDVGEKHEDFGDVKKVIIDEFVRQKYLEYVRIPHTDPLEFEFRWGQRAEKEVSKMKMLEFIGELHNQEPQSWTQQYREATSAESSQR